MLASLVFITSYRAFNCSLCAEKVDPTSKEAVSYCAKEKVITGVKCRESCKYSCLVVSKSGVICVMHENPSPSLQEDTSTVSKGCTVVWC